MPRAAVHASLRETQKHGLRHGGANGVFCGYVRPPVATNKGSRYGRLYIRQALAINKGMCGRPQIRAAIYTAAGSYKQEYIRPRADTYGDMCDRP